MIRKVDEKCARRPSFYRRVVHVDENMKKVLELAESSISQETQRSAAEMTERYDISMRHYYWCENKPGSKEGKPENQKKRSEVTTALIA